MVCKKSYRSGLTCLRIDSTGPFERERSRFSCQHSKKSLASVGLVVLSLGFVWATQADTRDKAEKQPGVSSESPKGRQNESKKDASVRFLTDFNVALEAVGVSGGDYVAKTEREVQFDALRVKDWFLHFGVREEILFDPSPSQLDHELEYLGIGYQTKTGRIRFFWDHTCHNPSRKLPERERNDIHWNELGIGYETTGMMLGHKNDGIRFNPGSEWLHNINWRASLSRIWMKSENDYEWMLKLAIRDDVFRMGNQVFYIQLVLDSIYDDRGVSLNPRLEIGDRICLNDSICLTPFVSYEHFHDWYSLGEGEDFFSAGLRLEMALGQEGSDDFSNPQKPGISWPPRFHITGGYAMMVDNEDYGYGSDVGIDLDLLRLDQNKKLSLNTYAGILTIPHDLNPYVVMYRIGPSLAIELDSFDLRLFHSYSGLYGLEDEGVIRDYNILGLEIKDNNASHWNWNAKIGVYPSTKDFDYWGDLQGSLGYNLYKKGITPYINCSGHYLQDNSSVLGYAVEGGVKIPGRIGSLYLYLRHQDDFDVFRFGRGRQTLLGFRRKI